MNAEEILGRIRDLRALVVGDICLDRWCTYDPKLAEPSRETGLDRVAVVSTETTAGAGGTVANNLCALGAQRVAVLGAIGDDGHGYELKQALNRAGADSTLLLNSPNPTFTYTKLLNSQTGDEDLGRIDYVAGALPPDVDRAIAQRLEQVAHEFDVILALDQSETGTPGVVTPLVRGTLAHVAADNPHMLLWADSRMRGELFRSVVLKVNDREAREACERIGAPSFSALREAVGNGLLLVTHGRDGVLLVQETGEEWVRTKPVEKPVDICGAGDSFSAGASLALAAGAPPADAARFGNFVASVTIMKKGTGTASPAEVLRAERELGV